MDKDTLELNKLRIETDKMLADMKHDIKQEMHWEENQKHWQRQQWYWTVIVTIAAIAILVQPFLTGWAKEIFGNG